MKTVATWPGSATATDDDDDDDDDDDVVYKIGSM